MSARSLWGRHWAAGISRSSGLWSGCVAARMTMGARMELKLRRGVPADSAECGRICFEAFKSIADRHNFPQDFPSPDVASGLMSFLLAHPNFYSTVAELDGRIVGSNFLDERSQIGGVGPISVDPHTQTRGVGRRLMEDVLARSRARAFVGVRLVQAGYNNQNSLSLHQARISHS